MPACLKSSMKSARAITPLCVGRQVEILVEGPSKKNPARMMGRTRTNKIVLSRIRAPSRPDHGFEDQPGRLLHALRRSRDHQHGINFDMHFNLSTLSVAWVWAWACASLWLTNPSAFAANARKFPRSLPCGVVLMLLGTGWFLWYLNQESISDFAAYKPALLAGFAAVGVGSCIYVQDFWRCGGWPSCCCSWRS